MTISIAGGVANRLEAALLKAGRAQGLASLPAAGAQCFFEDPLGAVLGSAAPRCPPEPNHPSGEQRLWMALCKGMFDDPVSGRRHTYFELVGNATGTPQERRRKLQQAAQWTFLHWLHWYQLPTQRFATFRNVVLLQSFKHAAPYRRIWSGYLHTVQDIARRAFGTASPADVPPLTQVATPPFQHRFQTEPKWADALGRLATKDEVAGAHMTAAQLLGDAAAAKALPDWSWDAPAATSANAITVNNHRCAPSALKDLLDALSLDRWLAVDRKLNLDQLAAQPAQSGTGDTQMDALKERGQLLRDMSHRMDLPRAKVGGSMRFARREGDVAIAPSAPERPKEPDPALLRLLNAPMWDPDPRLMTDELDPQQPGCFALSVRHNEFMRQFLDPGLGVMAYVEVRKGSELHRSVAISHDYVPPEPSTPSGRGKLLMEVSDADALPFFSSVTSSSDASGQWTWAANAALALETGEPVILLRINL